LSIELLLESMAKPKRSINNEKSENRLHILLDNSEYALFLKTKSSIQKRLADEGLIAANENITYSQVLRVMISNYAKEKKIA
jgi:hypothetical protein